MGREFIAKVFGGLFRRAGTVTEVESPAEFVRDRLNEYRAGCGHDAEILHWPRKNRDLLPALRFDCGYEDSLLRGNRALPAALLQEGVARVYEEFDGGRNWDYWRLHVRNTLRLVSRLEEQRAGIMPNV